jgi:hypothetical protein
MNFKPGDEVLCALNSATGQLRKYKVLAGPEKGNSGNALYYKLKISGNPLAPDSWVREDHIRRAADRKALHRALDAVMDRVGGRSRGKDARFNPEIEGYFPYKSCVIHTLPNGRQVVKCPDGQVMRFDTEKQAIQWIDRYEVKDSKSLRQAAQAGAKDVSIKSMRKGRSLFELYKGHSIYRVVTSGGDVQYSPEGHEVHGGLFGSPAEARAEIDKILIGVKDLRPV